MNIPEIVTDFRAPMLKLGLMVRNIKRAIIRIVNRKTYSETEDYFD